MLISKKAPSTPARGFLFDELRGGSRAPYLPVPVEGLVGDGESAGFPDGLLGSAGLPDGFIGLLVLTLPAVLPLVVPFDIPVVVPVVPGVAVPGEAVPVPPVPAPPTPAAPPACASANVLESANTVANASVLILMGVSLG